jgi:hypothetical protein
METMSRMREGEVAPAQNAPTGLMIDPSATFAAADPPAATQETAPDLQLKTLKFMWLESAAVSLRKTCVKLFLNSARLSALR